MQVQQNKQRKVADFPAIPEKKYFTISQAGELCSLKPYVLRYWEQEFPQIKPVKRRGNRRYYQRQDILLIRKIRQLLYEKGFTIEGAKTQLSSSNKQNNNMDLNRIADSMKQAINKLEGILLDLRVQKSTKVVE